MVGVILTDKFCLFFTDMTYVPGQFIPYFFCFLAPSHKRPFPKVAAYNACGHNNSWTVGWIAFKFVMVVLGISDNLINFWDESNENKMAAAAI